MIITSSHGTRVSAGSFHRRISKVSDNLRRTSCFKEMCRISSLFAHANSKKCKVQTLWPVCSNTVVNCEDAIELPLHPKPFLFDLDPEVKMTIKIEKL